MKEEIQIATLVASILTLCLSFMTYHKVRPAHATCFAENMVSKMADGKAYRVKRSDDNSWEVQQLEK